MNYFCVEQHLKFMLHAIGYHTCYALFMTDDLYIDPSIIYSTFDCCKFDTDVIHALLIV